jgi:hypothetical protein
MTKTTEEYISIRAFEILDQAELVRLLKSLFPESIKRVDVRRLRELRRLKCVPSNSPKLDEIRELIVTRRRQGVHEFCAFTIGQYRRKYTLAELRSAEILRLNIAPHFEPAGEECGTLYETLCPHCNLGRQVSDLILDLGRVPQHEDIAETIASVEWVVSSKFAQVFTENGLSGGEFLPVFEFKNPTAHSRAWHQLRVTGSAGSVQEKTELGKDPFSSEVAWRCPLGHSVVAQILSDIYLSRDAWDGSDVACHNFALRARQEPSAPDAANCYLATRVQSLTSRGDKRIFGRSSPPDLIR